MTSLVSQEKTHYYWPSVQGMIHHVAIYLKALLNGVLAYFKAISQKQQEL